MSYLQYFKFRCRFFNGCKMNYIARNFEPLKQELARVRVYSSCSYLIPCNLYFCSYCIVCKRQRLKINDPVIITIAVECGDPGKPTNGKQIVRKGYVYGGSVKFVCDENYTVVGADVMFCQANKSWSSSVPRCVGKYSLVRENKRHLPSLVLARALESINNSKIVKSVET